jgi:predicted metal-dependent hydrolase
MRAASLACQVDEWMYDPAMDCSACGEPPPRQLLEGIEQFNRGEYFEQHETLELLWRAETRPVRRLYQGILQIGVAFHHLRRLNHHGAIYMLTRGSRYLEPFAPACQRVDVARLLRDAGAARAEVERLGASRLGDFDWTLAPCVYLRS